MKLNRCFGDAEVRPVRRCRRAFTLIELLVVVAIIGVLLSMLLPVVQSVRESSRQTQCMNNLKQLGLGALQHEMARGRFPTGGWGWDWDGDADRGDGADQPGGWTYNLLIYIEQPALANLGATAPSISASATFDPMKLSATAMLVSNPLTILHCPTRRIAQLYPNSLGGNFVAYNSNPLALVAKTDYAANAGDNGVDQTDGGPTTYAAAYNGTYAWADTSAITGVCYQRSTVRAADVHDGLSNTYLFGEKYLDPDHYLDGTDPADNEDAYTGWDNDVFRNTNVMPLPDTHGVSNASSFGSAHNGTFNMVFCDGSVHSLTFTIDAQTHQWLGNRQDNKVIDLSKMSH